MKLSDSSPHRGPKGSSSMCSRLAPHRARSWPLPRWTSTACRQASPWACSRESTELTHADAEQISITHRASVQDTYRLLGGLQCDVSGLFHNPRELRILRSTTSLARTCTSASHSSSSLVTSCCVSTSMLPLAASSSSAKQRWTCRQIGHCADFLSA